MSMKTDGTSRIKIFDPIFGFKNREPADFRYRLNLGNPKANPSGVDSLPSISTPAFRNFKLSTISVFVLSFGFASLYVSDFNSFHFTPFYNDKLPSQQNVWHAISKR